MKRHKFSLSHFKLMSTFLGDLFPLTWYEVLPGDTIQQSTSMLVRLAPIVVPIMHPCHVTIHHWFVPNRLIWQGTVPTSGSSLNTGGWENFITGGPNGTDTTQHPYMTVSANATVDTLSDYLGVPTSGYSGTSYSISALPFRAYGLIWNEFYRDQDLQTPVTVSVADGLDVTTSTAIQEVTWDKDYLTTCRPWESKGPSVSIFSAAGGGAAPLSLNTTGTATTTVTYPGLPAQAANSQNTGASAYSATTDTIVAGTSWFANLQQATGVDINTLRHQFAIQRFQEARAKYGSRYTEYLRAAFGVRSSDGRLQRPEYLGGGRSTVQFSEVMQTAPTTSGTQQPGVGQYGGHGISATRSNRFRRFIPEHGIVMTLASVRPMGIYTQRLDRAWLRGVPGNAATLGTKEDYFTPELQHIGQQLVSGQEVDNSLTRSQTFGYQDRYDEYRRKLSDVSGQFRISGGTGLDIWNMAREFAAPPALNATFVACLPSNRGFASLTSPQLYVMAQHSIQARRCMSREGVGYVR